MSGNPQVEATKLKEQLRKWLSESQVKSACAIGIKNCMTEHKLVNPRVYIVEGTQEHVLSDSVNRDQASASLFLKREYSLKGTTGCLCYDIMETDYMVCVLWEVPVFTDRASENKFNLRCVKAAECNEALFKFLNEHSRVADGEVVEEENGYRLCGCMSRETKSLLIIDVYESHRVGAMRPSEPIQCGRQLELRIRDWISHTEVKSACGIGINNYTTSVLQNPSLYLYSGTCTYEPTAVVESEMAAASLFCKREFSLLGSSGCLTYDIKNDERHVLAVLWYIPLMEALQENRFYAAVINRDDGTTETLYKKLWNQTRRARDGEVMRDGGAFQVFARMEATPKALLLVSVRPKKAVWSLW